MWPRCCPSSSESCAVKMEATGATLPSALASSASMRLNRCKRNSVSFYRYFPCKIRGKFLGNPWKTFGDYNAPGLCLHAIPVIQPLSSNPLFPPPCYQLLLSLVFFSLYISGKVICCRQHICAGLIIDLAADLVCIAKCSLFTSK